MIKTQLFLEGFNVDLDNDVVIPLNYGIADVREPEKKTGNYTKTISLPGTTNNNKIFSFLFDTSVTVNSSGTYQYDLGFDPNLKSECVITYEGAEIFRGYLELNKIVKIDNYKVRYEVTCAGNLVNLFFSIGEKYLSDISLSEYNHNYTYHIQKASWDNYIYKNGVTVPFNKGDGYVYPYIDYATNNDTDWKVSDFKPAVYVYTILKKIFNTEGFTWTSSFLESNHFKSLIIPYTQGNLILSNSQINDRTFRASSNSDQTYISSGNVNYNVAFQDDFTAPNFDTGNNYSTVTYRYTIPKTGIYIIESLINFDVKIMTSSPITLQKYLSYPIGYFIVYKNSTTVHSVPIYLVSADSTALQPSAVNVSTGYNAGIPISSGTYTLAYSCFLGTQPAFNVNDIVNIIFKPDALGLYLLNNSLPSATNYFEIRIKSGSLFYSRISNPITQEGDMVEMNTVLPQKIKQKDFVSSIIKLFNLYIDQDKSNSNNFIIEPRDDFYASSGTTRDWTYKLDMSRDLEIIPMGELDAKTYNFTYKDDADYYNQKYLKDYGINYGTKLYSVQNDHRKNEKKTEVIFSPTPLADRNSTDRIVPRIFDLTNIGIPTPKTGNIRILYYGGVKSTLMPYNYYTSSGGITPNIEITYPYAGHLDNTLNPTFDLNFGMPIEVYYTATAYTDGNLFNRYWKKMIDEITNKDSKIIRGYFHLNPVDIMKLDYRDVYYFERDYYRLNKIIDYNPAEVKPTLCEFIKIKESPIFSYSTGTITGGLSNTGIGVENIVTQYSSKTNEYSNFNQKFQLQSGINNIIDYGSLGTVVTGNNNYIGYSKNISVIGSSGITVLPGTTNLNVIGSFDATYDSSYSNKTIINNDIFGIDNIIYSTGTYTFNGTESGSFAIFEITTSLGCYLPYPAQLSNGYKLEIKNANNSTYVLTVNIQSDTITPIWSAGDGSNATQLKMSAKDSKLFTYYNQVWYIH